MVIGVAMPTPPISPQGPCRAGLVACTPQEPINWILAGMVGLAFCVALLLVTIVVESFIWIGRRSAAFARTR